MKYLKRISKHAPHRSLRPLHRAGDFYLFCSDDRALIHLRTLNKVFYSIDYPSKFSFSSRWKEIPSKFFFSSRWKEIKV